MAKQNGPLFITGTVNGICFYKLDGKYYTRRKSSLSRKRVKRDPAFARTRANANLMGRASKLAAEVYRSLPGAQRAHALYRAMTGEALQLLKKGMDEAGVQERLRAMNRKAVARPKQAPVAVLSGGLKARVKAVWTSGGKGKVVTEVMPARDVTVERMPERTANTWTVIRGDKVRQVDVGQWKHTLP